MKFISKNILSIMVLSINLFAVEVTQEEMKQHVLKAAKYCEEVGVDKCIKDFDDVNNTKWNIKDKELYIFAYDISATLLGHPYAKALKGKNLYSYKDRKRNKLFQNFIKIVKTKNEGFSEYVWINPYVNKEMDKIAYIKGIDNNNKFIGAGIYK